MGEIFDLATRPFKRRGPEPKIEVVGYRLVQNGKPVMAKVWNEVSLAIEAAKFRAAENAGMAALISAAEYLEDAVKTLTCMVGVEKVERCWTVNEGEVYHYSGICLVTYTAGTYLPQVQMLTQPVPLLHTNA